MNNESSNNIFAFVKTHFFKIMGVFLIIGLIQYACSDKEPVVVEEAVGPVTLIDRVDNEPRTFTIVLDENTGNSIELNLD